MDGVCPESLCPQGLRSAWPFQPSEVTLRILNRGSGRDPGPWVPCSWVWSWASQCGPQRDKLSSVLGPGPSLRPPCFLAPTSADPRGPSIGRALGWAPDVQELRLCTGALGPGDAGLSLQRHVFHASPAPSGCSLSSAPPWACPLRLLCLAFPVLCAAPSPHEPLPTLLPAVSPPFPAAPPPSSPPAPSCLPPRHTVQQETNRTVAASASALKQTAELLRGCPRVRSRGLEGGRGPGRGWGGGCRVAARAESAGSTVCWAPAQAGQRCRCLAAPGRAPPAGRPCRAGPTECGRPLPLQLLPASGLAWGAWWQRRLGLGLEVQGLGSVAALPGANGRCWGRTGPGACV